MTIKWSKHKAIEYIQALQSPIEEQAKGNGSGTIERMKVYAASLREKLLPKE